MTAPKSYCEASQSSFSGKFWLKIANTGADNKSCFNIQMIIV